VGESLEVCSTAEAADCVTRDSIRLTLDAGMGVFCLCSARQLNYIRETVCGSQHNPRWV